MFGNKLKDSECISIYKKVIELNAVHRVPYTKGIKRFGCGRTNWSALRDKALRLLKKNDD